MITNLYTINYHTLDVTGNIKIKVIAECKSKAIEKLKKFEVGEITSIKITKEEKVLF